MFTDPGHRLAECAGHPGPGAFGCGSGSSTSTAQADRAGQFSNEEVAFGVGLRCPFDVAGCLRLLDVLVDLDEASPVGVLGSRVEDLTGIAERVGQAGRAATTSRRGSLSASAAARSSTWNSRPGSARSRARYRMPCRSRIRTVRPSNTTDQ